MACKEEWLIVRRTPCKDIKAAKRRSEENGGHDIIQLKESQSPRILTVKETSQANRRRSLWNWKIINSLENKNIIMNIFLHNITKPVTTNKQRHTAKDNSINSINLSINSIIQNDDAGSDSATILIAFCLGVFKLP